MPAKFGTSGLRGLIAEVAGDTAQRHVRAFAQHLLSQGLGRPHDEVFIGWDLRASSPAIATDVAQALLLEKMIPAALGTIPTPAMAAYAMAHKRASIMVTGSHIPADRNGIKFYLPQGEITKSDEAAIASGAAALHGLTSSGFNLSVSLEHRQKAITAFLERCAVIAPAGSLSGLTIGLYEHSTVGRDLLREVLSRAGARVVLLGFSDDFVPLDTEAVSEEVQTLLKGWSVAHGLDAIVSADGDADRPLLADETGMLIRGDIMGIIATRVLGAKAIATPVTSSSGLEQVLDAQIYRSKVGSPHVIAAMLQAQREGQSPVVGFEPNGGYLTLTDVVLSGGVLAALPTRDAFLPLLTFLTLAKKTAQPLSALVAALDLPSALATRLEHIDTEKSIALLQRLQIDEQVRRKFLNGLGVLKAWDSIDGLRMQLQDRCTVHLRPSGNAPELRLYVEAPTHVAATMLLTTARSKLEMLLR